MPYDHVRKCLLKSTQLSERTFTSTESLSLRNLFAPTIVQFSSHRCDNVRFNSLRLLMRTPPLSLAPMCVKLRRKVNLDVRTGLASAAAATMTTTTRAQNSHSTSVYVSAMSSSSSSSGAKFFHVRQELAHKYCIMQREVLVGFGRKFCRLV